MEVERRKQILDAACTVIAKNGLQDLRLLQVAAVAGVSSGTIHYYFDTKKELINAAFEYNFKHSLERRKWLRDETREPLELLGEIVESYLPTRGVSLRAWRVWANLWAEGIRDPALRKINEELYDQWRELVRHTIAAAQRAGTAREGDPELLANMLIGMVDGLAMQVLLHAKAMSLDTMRETCRAFIDELIAR
ncbi:MAG TPA: TetR/AcrR family transcriptional regulator [Pseudonocardia sp.]|uniref:TetR/AcrR family transcriptional regulator n=1 Tax=Pseudonocardia sp. TaxID=60912 RepID=UPI002CFB20D3|nr:TetR/AcrR family transcriptional regulator [Pseudonocardia sp.]HTF50746.1 TetR/AcrR family transcriptional regulator [Pseudonocardia sp.]